MKKILALAGVAGLAIALTGCPANSTQRQKIAQAAQTASTVISGFQQSEIAAHNQGIISNDDHVFIQKQLLTVAETGKTLDSCLLSTTTSAGDIACLQTATTTIDLLNSQGALAIKSAQTKQEFQTAMDGLKIALTAVSQVVGGN